MIYRSKRYKTLPYESGRYCRAGSEEYLQWWYFDAEFDSGHRLMTIMMPVMLGDVDDDCNGPVPGVTFVIMDPEHRNLASHAYYPGAFAAGRDSMDARFAGDYVRFVDGHYEVSVHQGDLGFDLVLEPGLPPWPPFPGRDGFMSPAMLWPLARGRYFNYASFVPRGKATATLHLPGGPHEVSGEGYHEQGRTNAPFAGLFRYWYWTRMFLGDWTFIFPIARAPRKAAGATTRALLVYRGREPVADVFDFTGLALSHEIVEYRRHEETGREDVPARAVFTARTGKLRLEIEMDLYHELESFRFTPYAGRTELQPLWLQHVTRVSARLSLGGERYDLEGEGVFETMLTGAP